MRTLDLDIDYLDASGDGIARTGRGSIAVPLTIPGERVRIGLSPPTLIELLRASPHRVVPRCPHFDEGCGGCSWQHIAYAEQLRLKTALLDRLLKGTGAPAARPTLPGTASEPWGYRHKVHFVFGQDRGLQIGHYARGSRRLVPVRECPVHDERGNAVAFGFRDVFAKAGIVPAGTVDRRSGRSPGVLRSIAVRVGLARPETLATLVVADDRDKRLRDATRRAMTGPAAPTALHVNLHPRGDAFIFGRETRRIAGPERLREEVAGASFLISPTAFFQTNVHAAGQLVALTLDAVPEAASVLDLYAGAGLFALPLAKRGARVTAIEENRAAVADGEASARLNRIPADRCRFIARRVEAALGSVRPADAVVMDPPREGCSPEVLAAVFGSLQPHRVVYISCNPEALARDLEMVRRFRYTIDLVQPVDMFPHTAHVETVVVLTAPGSPRTSGPRR